MEWLGCYQDRELSRWDPTILRFMALWGGIQGETAEPQTLLKPKGNILFFLPLRTPTSLDQVRHRCKHRYPSLQTLLQKMINSCMSIRHLKQQEKDRF